MLFRSNKKGLVPETDNVGDIVEVVDDGEVEEDFDHHFSCIEPSEQDETHEGEDAHRWPAKAEEGKKTIKLGALPCFAFSIWPRPKTFSPNMQISQKRKHELVERLRVRADPADTLGFEPTISRSRSGCDDATTPCAQIFLESKMAFLRELTFSN
eukprot:2236136-Amphidinium_carterae.1